MGRTAAAWAGFWTLFGLIDYAADRRSSSLCHATRWLFRTDTAAGRLAFTAAYGTGAMVLHRHVLKVIAEQDQDLTTAS